LALFLAGALGGAVEGGLAVRAVQVLVGFGDVLARALYWAVGLVSQVLRLVLS
jgi:hypothetical protein